MDAIQFVPICQLARSEPWDKGKLTGSKPPLLPKHVWTIRTRLQLLSLKRDLALFLLAIDSKLRGCDLVRLRTPDVAPNGYAIDRASMRQRKTCRPVKFEITEQTKLAIDAHLTELPAREIDSSFKGERVGLTSAQGSTPDYSAIGWL